MWIARKNPLLRLGLSIACLALSVLATGQHIQAADTVSLGIDVLQKNGFDLLQGKRVGLLTHPAGVNSTGVSTITTLNQSSAVNLTALFGPEHGIYGDEQAEVPVLDKIDARTSLPVYSLYGKYRKPTPEMLAKIDTLVIDLQDLGVRSYTYISCMKLAIEACFENSKEVVILDRPNPLGGLKVDGPPMETRWKSYVGAYQVPYVHGLTIGEIARMSVSKSGILDLSESQRTNGTLHVVTMDGWQRYMSWPQTGLDWKPTSPNIPSFESVVGYSMTGLGAQLGGFKHGIGSKYPFRHLRYPGVATEILKAELNALSIPGITFQQKVTKLGSGFYVNIDNWNAWKPTELSFHMMKLADKFEKTNPFTAATNAQATLFNKHVGSTNWWSHITTRGEQANVAAYITLWQRQAKQFQIESRRYWLYD